MRTLLITLASVALTSCVIVNAFYQKKQFYPSVIFITRSNTSMSVIYLQAFIGVLLVGKLFRFLFFGELRPTETENLIERSWHAISETCLAFTVFRDDLNPKFVALFTLLLFLKCFHWLAEDRVDYMERSPSISVLFHIRIASLLVILGSLDIMFIMFAYHSTMLKGASVQLVFGFEYAILLAVIITIIIKYSLHRYDLEQREIPWENKGVYLLYFELLVGLYKVVLYLSFIIVMARIHSFPLFAVRSMYVSVKAFQKALNDVILSRRAIRNMNELYPNATPEELANIDSVCIICREDMIGNGTSKKLPCNHIFHVTCLRSWFQRQQTCPTCRMNILEDPPNNQQQANNQQQQNQQQNNQQANVPNNQTQQTQQQGAQPNQQPPNLPAGQMNRNIRILFDNLNLVDNLADYVQDRQQRQTNARNSNLPGQSSATSQQDRNRARSTATTVLPPFMGFSFMPFLPFPPSNSQTNTTTTEQTNLSQLSEDELRALEGDERSALEARIRLLQNLRTSIDAFVLQFEQYNQLIVRSQQQQRSTESTAQSSSSTTDHKESNKDTKKEETNKSLNETKPEDQKPTTSGVEVSKKEFANEIKEEDIKKDELKSNKSIEKTNLVDKTMNDEELVRQLRLRKFNNQSVETDGSSIKNEKSN